MPQHDESPNALPPPEEIRARILAAVPGARVELVPNGAPDGQPSLGLDSDQALAVARFLHHDPQLSLDYCSNVTGVDWPEKVFQEKVRIKMMIEGEEKEVEDTVETRRPGYLEAVYHLYSMKQQHGPVVLRLRTGNRSDQVQLPSLTPVWRGAELQEREIFDLYGIVFEGHPDLRRILMWDGFRDHPMRKDYVEPDDYEYEPTAHDQVLAKARRRLDSVGGG